MQKVSTSPESRDSIREYFKRWPQFYIAIVYIFGPVYMGGLGPRTFLKTYHPKKEGTIINVGSGPFRLRDDVRNYDVTAYEAVDVVADATALPLPDSSVDGFLCDNVLEHIDRPLEAVTELHRVLRPGGVGYISTPFLYPFHASPYDYQRWSKEGLKQLCKDFNDVEVGVRASIFSTLSVSLCYLLPSLFSFGSDRVYWILVNVSLFIFFPIKFLDIIANRLPYASHTAAVFYCVVKK